MTDAYYRRRLKRELDRMAKLDREIATESERSFFEWLAPKVRAQKAGVYLRKDPIGWLWAQVTGRR